MKDVRPALRALILSSPAVTAIAGQRVFPNQLPQGERRPSVVYNRVSGIANYHMQGSGGLLQNVFQIDSIAETADLADALAIAVHDVLTGFSGPVQYGGSPPQTVIFQAILENNVRDLYDSATQLQRLTRDFAVWFQEYDTPVAPVPPGWVPTDLGPSVLRCWFPMDQITGSNGDAQASLVDKSGNSLNTQTQATTTARPTLIVGAKNGLNGLRFDAALGQYFSFNLNLFSGVTAATMITVIKLDNDPAVSNASSGWQRIGGSPQPENFPWTDGFLYTGLMSAFRYTAIEARPSLKTAYRIVAIHSAVNDWSLFIDGALIHHESVNTPDFGNPNLIALGGSWTEGNFMLGNMLDWAVYTTVNTTIRQQFETYLTNKFALP